MERLRTNYRRMLENELNDLDADEYGLNPDMDRSDIADIDKAFSNAPDPEATQETLVVSQKQKKEKEGVYPLYLLEGALLLFWMRDS